jgi:hypothetical protein
VYSTSDGEGQGPAVMFLMSVSASSFWSHLEFGRRHGKACETSFWTEIGEWAMEQELASPCA